MRVYTPLKIELTKLTELQRRVLEMIENRKLRFDRVTDYEKGVVNHFTAKTLCNRGLATSEYVFSLRYLSINENGREWLALWREGNR